MGLDPDTILAMISTSGPSAASDSARAMEEHFTSHLQLPTREEMEQMLMERRKKVRRFLPVASWHSHNLISSLLLTPSASLTLGSPCCIHARCRGSILETAFIEKHTQTTSRSDRLYSRQPPNTRMCLRPWQIGLPLAPSLPHFHEGATSLYYGAIVYFLSCT